MLCICMVPCSDLSECISCVFNINLLDRNDCIPLTYFALIRFNGYPFSPPVFFFFVSVQ